MKNNIFKLGRSKKKISLIDENNKKISQYYLYKKIEKIKTFIDSYSLVVLVAENSFEFIASYLAIINKPKIVTVLLDKSFNREYIESIIQKFNPNYVIVPQNIEIFKLEVIKTTKLNNYKILLTNNKKKKLNFLNLLLLSTSGTTQSPKFVRLSRQNIFDNTKKIINSLKIKKNQTTITTMPPGYSYGLSILNTHLFVGAKIVLNDNSLFEKMFWDKINNFKVNSFGGVPDFYNILKKLNFSKFINKNIKYLTQAGGKLDIETLKYFGNVCKKNRIKFYIMYGQTEASPRITLLNWRHFFSKIESVGKPLSGYRIKIIKKNKEIKKPFKKGEIVLIGKNVSLGYAKNFSDLKKGNVNQNILFTGDIGFKDKSGFLYVIGRTKRIIKIFGKRFNLNDIESFLKQQGYKISCKLIDDILNVEITKKKNSIKKIITKLILKKYNLNKNYISVSFKKKSFKNYI